MGISKILSSLWRNISLFLKNSNIKKGLSIFLFFSITILILFSNFNPKQVMLKPDEVAPPDVFGLCSTLFLSQESAQYGSLCGSQYTGRQH
jgi:hypothetical protein